ncbi:MAG: DUF86 domain-containing protein [Verrucomicrobiales bacterium]
MNEESLKHYFDALTAAWAIQRFSRGKNFEDYCSNDLLASAIERKFEIIGEALNRIKGSHPADLEAISDWPAIIGFRNILAHAYDHVEDSVVWGIATGQIPGFVTELEAIPGLLGDQGTEANGR